MEEANGYNTEVTQRAEGDASRFKSILTEYTRAPGVTRDRLYLDMMQSVLTNSSKVVIDQKTGSGNLLYMPLDKLMQQAAGATVVTSPDSVAPPRASSPTAPEAPAAADPSRTREGLRSRER
jgi:modulator of FtsH protease HflK